MYKKNLIIIENVSVEYKLLNDQVHSLKEYIIKKLKNQIQLHRFMALNEIDIKIKKGEIIGIIGKNGAGKSTLLKVVSRIIKPSHGNVQIYGNVIPLLELGAGFDYELTGEENVYLYGALLGFSESFLKEKYNEIVEFSELGEFMNNPIRNYSSGMIVRLAFSIATIVKPDILIVDEILAVGDESFQKKSKAKMIELMSSGVTVLFVSHSLQLIEEICSKVLWLDHGKTIAFGNIDYVIDKYKTFLSNGSIV